jgi:sugar phosphate isomerase/epimerase
VTSHLNRREWLAKSAAFLSATQLMQAAAGPKFKGPLGAELYTVRTIIDQDTDGVLKRIAEIGYTEVEPGRAVLDKLVPTLAKYKLKATSCHMEQELVVGGDTKVTLPQAIESAKKAGAAMMIFPYLAPAKRGLVAANGQSVAVLPDAMRKFADQMNEAGAKVVAAGMKFGYHNHAFEFGGKPGERPIDIFLERFDPKIVGFQLDVFWVSVAGNDPVEWIDKLKQRVISVHLKDKAADQPVLYAENVPKTTFKEVGNGALDFPAILKAAGSVGVKHFFVEQDQTPGDPVASLAQSYKYLRS